MERIPTREAEVLKKLGWTPKFCERIWVVDGQPDCQSPIVRLGLAVGPRRQPDRITCWVRTYGVCNIALESLYPREEHHYYDESLRRDLRGHLSVSWAPEDYTALKWPKWELSSPPSR